MITLYAACLRHLGLSQEDAGVIHARFGVAVRPDTISSWSSGRREPPFGAFADLQRYAATRKTFSPADVAEALYLVETTSASVADDLGLPSVNAMVVAIAADLLARSPD